MNDEDFPERMRRLESLLDQVEHSCAPESLEGVRELVRALLDVHRTALEDFLGTVGQTLAGDARRVMAAVVERPAVASLLIMHDLHPESFEERVRRAVDESNTIAGARVHAELERIEGQHAVVKIKGDNGPAGAMLRKTLERLACERAPDAVLEVRGGETPPSGFIPLTRLRARQEDAGK